MIIVIFLLALKPNRWCNS